MKKSTKFGKYRIFPKLINYNVTKIWLHIGYIGYIIFKIKKNQLNEEKKI